MTNRIAAAVGVVGVGIGNESGLALVGIVGPDYLSYSRYLL